MDCMLNIKNWNVVAQYWSYMGDTMDKQTTNMMDI